MGKRDSLISVINADRHEQQKRGIFHHDRLMAFPFLSGRDPLFLAALAQQLEVLLVKEGDIIMNEGSIGDTAYFLIFGLVEVFCKSDLSEAETRKIAMLTPGSMFGEMAILERGQTKRSASVKALETCDCRIISKSVFRLLLNRWPAEKRHFEQLAQARLQTNAATEPKVTHISRAMVGVLRARARFLRLRDKFKQSTGSSPEDAALRSVKSFTSALEPVQTAANVTSEQVYESAERKHDAPVCTTCTLASNTRCCSCELSCSSNVHSRCCSSPRYFPRLLGYEDVGSSQGQKRSPRMDRPLTPETCTDAVSPKSRAFGPPTALARRLETARPEVPKPEARRSVGSSEEIMQTCVLICSNATRHPTPQVSQGEPRFGRARLT
ncbi:unnamed protein product [Polarella glacialis]|uniref:Cyclic nucleotide-binding domain-containing protein n=1 Tax=Polarella glacialis TaxID=89957 RepID=A0A813D0G0_POLGL|nr:unnamed protein product [Polarella glacialis]CAE8681590.1 unnamed protein product [Polarella glacialis]